MVRQNRQDDEGDQTELEDGMQVAFR